MLERLQRDPVNSVFSRDVWDGLVRAGAHVHPSNSGTPGAGVRRLYESSRRFLADWHRARRARTRKTSFGVGCLGVFGRLGLLVSVFVVFGLGVGVAWGASVTRGWWGVSGGARPTFLHAPVVEQQQLDFVEGEFLKLLRGAAIEIEVDSTPVACYGQGAIGIAFCGADAAGLPVVTGAQELQAALEVGYGAPVTVSEEAAGVFVVSGPGANYVPAVKLVALPVGSTATWSGTAKITREGGSGRIVIQAFDLGDAPIEGLSVPVVLADELPEGLQAHYVTAITGNAGFPEAGPGQDISCSVATVSCTFTGGDVSPSEDHALAPYERMEMVVWVTTAGAPGSIEEENVVNVSGGGVPATEKSFPVQSSEAEVPFGVESSFVSAEEEGGLPASQAGGHPFQLTSMVRFNETGTPPFQPAQPRNLEVALPAGFVGDAQATPKCSFAAFSKREVHINECPADSTIGVASALTVSNIGSSSGQGNFTVPVFNLTPAVGEPARFGFYVDNVVAVLNTHLRAGGDYAVVTTVQDLTQIMATVSSVVTLWGTPGEPVHDNARGWACFPENGTIEVAGCGVALGSEKPLLTMPSSCEAPFQGSFAAQSWVPGAVMQTPVFSAPEPIDGCNQEPFTPTLDVTSNDTQAYSPAELKVQLKVPQQISEVVGGVSEADVQNTTVSLPAGLQLNPSAAGGLGACSESEIGYQTTHGQQVLFDEETQEERDGQTPHRYGCPEAAKVGTVRVHAPLLEEEITGAVYQAAQEANPFKSLLALYIIAEAPKTGVRIRLAGQVQVQPTGQIVSTFAHTPQVPFEEFELKFFGGSKSPLATGGCGTYTTSSVIESWAGGQATPFSSFPVSTGCITPGFSPAFSAGTVNNDAGAFSSLVTRISRKDGEQDLSTVSLTLPKGLAGMISKVTLCKEPEASQGSCGAASKIGYIKISAGVGSEPIVLPEPGKGEDSVYITGPYKGAPFGVSIVIPAEAGPFNLDENNHPVVIRGKIEVNPHTSQVTISTDPAPTELHNIALDARSAEVVVNKPGFIFNPTNCQAASITGTVSSSVGTRVPLSTRFQTANCATLPFKPQFKVYTHAGHTRRKGAYLQVVVKSSKGQANIGKVHVTLPKDLPSRVETLNKACSEKQFATNPSGCPAGSVVGTAKATTPVLPVPLTGSAIFVSHGGAAFPDLDVVLQGDGVTVDLTGNTSIKKNITTSTFASVPDVPVEKFTLTLPEGPHSALAAYGNLCKSAQKMPTVITGQNGAVVKQDTKITVTGCKAKAGAKKARGKAKKKKS